jgi:hypothetical protein
MKKLRATSLLILSGASMLTLSACGEGWVAVPYEGGVPYTEERTAGSGVKFVRDHLLPAKGPILDPVPSPIFEPIVQDSQSEVKDAAPLFTGKQLKK